MKKRIKTVGVLLVFTGSVAAQAEDYTYTTNPDDTITITKYIGTNTVVIIPDKSTACRFPASGILRFLAAGV